MFDFLKIKVHGRDVLQSMLVGAGDGITVPLTILCGLVSAGLETPMLVTIGVIVSIAGALTMGIGAYVTEKSELKEFEHMYSSHNPSEASVLTTERDAKEKFSAIGLKGDLLEQASADIENEKHRWMEIQLKEQPDLVQPDNTRPFRTALFIFISYLAGGLFATMPYWLFSDQPTAFRLSVFFGLNLVFILSYFKFLTRGMNPWKGAIREALITAIAAGSIFLVAKLF